MTKLPIGPIFPDIPIGTIIFFSVISLQFCKKCANISSYPIHL